MRELRVYVLALIVPLSLAIGCSSSSGSDGQLCNENPWECPTGQTCWPKDESSFACFNSGPGEAGDACKNTVGYPTCGDGLACLETDAGGGICASYCDSANPSHACSAGQTCQTAILVGAGAAQFQVCVSTNATATDAGGEPSSSASDAGGSADTGVLMGDGSSLSLRAASPVASGGAGPPS